MKFRHPNVSTCSGIIRCPNNLTLADIKRGQIRWTPNDHVHLSRFGGIVPSVRWILIYPWICIMLWQVGIKCADNRIMPRFLLYPHTVCRMCMTNWPSQMSKQKHKEKHNSFRHSCRKKEYYLCAYLLVYLGFKSRSKYYMSETLSCSLASIKLVWRNSRWANLHLIREEWVYFRGPEVRFFPLPFSILVLQKILPWVGLSYSLFFFVTVKRKLTN